MIACKLLNHRVFLFFLVSWLLSSCVNQRRQFPETMHQIHEELLRLEHNSSPLSYDEMVGTIDKGEIPRGLNRIHDLLGEKGAGANLSIGNYLLESGKWCNGRGDALSARLVVLLWQRSYEDALPFLAMAFLNDDVFCAELAARLLTQKFLTGTVPHDCLEKSIQILFLAADCENAPLRLYNPQLLSVGVMHFAILGQKGAYRSALTPQLQQHICRKLAELSKPQSSPTIRFSSMAVLADHFKPVASELLPTLMEDKRECVLDPVLFPTHLMGISGSVRCAAIAVALEKDLPVPLSLIRDHVKETVVVSELNSEHITVEEAMELGEKREFLSLLQKLLEKRNE